MTYGWSRPVQWPWRKRPRGHSAWSHQ